MARQHRCCLVGFTNSRSSELSSPRSTISQRHEYEVGRLSVTQVCDLVPHEGHRRKAPRRRDRHQPKQLINIEIEASLGQEVSDRRSFSNSRIELLRSTNVYSLNLRLRFFGKRLLVTDHDAST